jgi:hypothetical protein
VKPVEVFYFGEWMHGIVVRETITRWLVRFVNKSGRLCERWVAKTSEHVREVPKFRSAHPYPDLPSEPVPEYDHPYTGACCTFPEQSLVHS